MTEQDYPAVIWAVTTAAAVMVGLAGELLAPQSGSRAKVLGHTKTLDQRIFSNRPRTQQSTPDTSQHPTDLTLEIRSESPPTWRWPFLHPS